MWPDKYMDERSKIINSFSHKLNIWGNDFLSGKFNLVSAGLKNYLPQIDYELHEEIFKDILLHQRLSNLEQSHQEVLDHVKFEGLSDETSGLLKKGGAVICTFHTGSYRIINQVFVKNKIPFTLVMAKSVMDAESEQLTHLYRQLSGNEDTSSFAIMDAESPSSGLQMLRELKKGRNLVLYIDGNTGAGSNDIDKNNLCDIRFLHQRIFARKGIAFLAHIAKSPIITIACYRKSMDDIRLRFFDTIYSGADQDREAFARNTTQKIYDFVAPVIQEFPGQWEAWMYLHKVANIVHADDPVSKPIAKTNISKNARVRLNSKEFGVFKVLDDFYLFKKSSYTSFPIDKDLYGFLHSAILKPIMKREIGGAIFQQLYDNSVFISD